MAEYIEKKKAVDAVFNGCGACTEEIEDLPTVDIVRCRECKYSTLDDLHGNYWCNRTMSVTRVGGEDFCSYGREK